METRASHVLIGSFALIIFVCAFLFVLWIGKLSLTREWDFYDIVFKEAVTGLSVGGAVQYNGIQVGEVRKLSLAPDDPRQVIANVRVNAETPVKNDTKAKLALTGLTGVAVIQLSGGTPGSPSLAGKKDGPAPRIIADESALQKLLASSEGIVTNVNDVLYRTTQLLSDENVSRVSRTLEHIDQVASAVAGEREDLRTMIVQLSAASLQLKATLGRLDKVMTSTNDLVNNQLRTTFESTRASLESAQRLADSAYAMLEQNRGAVSSFSQQGLMQVGPAVSELRETLHALRIITDRLQENPAGYLLGREQVKEFEPK